MSDLASASGWCTNGEIYNYRELRKELEGLGRRFRTSSDTEVLLAAYEAWGPGCLSKAERHFRLRRLGPRGRNLVRGTRSAWCEASLLRLVGRSLLRRERGEGHRGGRAGDAGSGSRSSRPVLPRGLRPCSRRHLARDAEAASGHHLTVHVGRGDQWNGLPEQERYYDIPFGRVDSLPLDEGGILEALDERLRTAVRRQMVSDVPIGAFLSGGVDSSLVVGYMAEHATGPIDTFSASFADDPRDEAPYAEAVSKRYGTRHHRVVMGRERLGDLNDLACRSTSRSPIPRRAHRHPELSRARARHCGPLRRRRRRDPRRLPQVSTDGADGVARPRAPRRATCAAWPTCRARAFLPPSWRPRAGRPRRRRPLRRDDTRDASERSPVVLLGRLDHGT